MLAILSPAKDMKVVPLPENSDLPATLPEFIRQASVIVRELKKMNQAELAETMKMSKSLATLNFQRYRNWSADHDSKQSHRAILTYTGEAYRGLGAGDFSIDELKYSQEVLRILSGLYGVLRPLDLIQEYRLEMGSKISFQNHRNLYDFWKAAVSKAIQKAIASSPGDPVLVNLASKEYASVLDVKVFKNRVVSPNFYSEHQGKITMVTVFAKRARGLMARFIIENQLERVDDLKAFNAEGYYFDSKRSTDNEWVFLR
ncbi:MAG: peroxide stress protein YaaA [Prolixibacteraceae bacterium]|nr:peroxide stress protein YaaA [Prolixibacteraceae bacterium]